MTGMTWGDHRPWRPHGDLLGAIRMMETTWGRRGDDVDDVGTTGTMWGQRG